MFDLIFDNPIRFILAFVIGIATAWWIWGRLGEIVSDTVDSATDTVGDVASGTVDAAKGAGGAVVGGVAAAGAGAAALASDAKDAAVDTASSVKDAAVDTAGSAKAKVQDVAGKPKIAMAVGDPDDLTRIKGIGPKLNDLCQSLGVQRFDQIAAWKKADVAEVDQYLKIKGRIDRDEWVKQAKLLAARDDAAHAAKYSLK